MYSKIKDCKRLYFDTNIFIYFFEQHAEFSDKVALIFDICEKNNITIITSEITITECLIGAYKRKNEILVKRYEDFFSVVSEAITIIPISTEILVDVPKIAGGCSLKIIDAMHMTTALHLQCDGFLTNDKGIDCVDIDVLKLFEDRS